MHSKGSITFIIILIFNWNYDVLSQQDDSVRLELMPNQNVQEKAVKSNSVFTCVPKGPLTKNVENIRWLNPMDQTVPGESDSRIYSEMHDNALLLIIKNTERSDAGMYKCIAESDGRVLSTEFLLKPYVDITWVDVPQLQHPIADTEDTIKCEVNADPPASINWSKDGHIYKADERCKFVNNGIRCSPINEGDNGSYSCRAVVSATGRVEEKSISVEVYVKPSIEGAQEIYEAIEDNALTLTCNARGKPLPTYTWLDKNNNNLKDRTGYIINVTDGVGTLKINRVGREDSGKITCVAKNVAGEDSTEMKVQVIVKPKIVKFDGKTIAEGEIVQLQCYVQAEPRPKVEFYNYGTEQIYTVDSDYDNERIRVFSAMEKDTEVPDAVLLYTLEINRVHRSDDGDYKCLAKNTGGTVEARAHLQVEYVPVFVNKTDSILSWIENSINITCQTLAIPNATITWSTDNRIDLKTDPNILIEGNQRTSTLTVNPVEKYYFGRYQCKAKNKLGENTHSISLTEASFPDAIMQVNFIHKTATTVTIGLHGPKNDGGFPVDSFVVEYWREGVEDNTKRRIWSISPTYILEKLEPDTMYYFRFAAVNRVGTGPWTTAESHIMPKKAAPEEPTILNADGGIIASPYSNMYNLEWKVPQDNGEKIKHFEITYFPVVKVGNEYERTGQMIMKEVQHPGKTQLFIEGLDPGTLYKIEIRANNEIGNSVPSDIIVKTQDDYLQTSTSAIENDDGSMQPQLTMTNFSMEIIIVIAVVVVVLIIIAVDIACYVTNKCGILMCLCVHLCNKQVPNDKVKEAHMEEGKTKDSKDLRKNFDDGRHVVDDDEAKDATEETPMIDGNKIEKEQEAKRNTVGNDTNMAKDSVV